MDKSRGRSGLSVKHIMIPAGIMLLLLHTCIVLNTIRINRAGQTISGLTQRGFSYTQTAKEFETASDLLADKARLYVSTGALEYVDNYLREIDRIEQRDEATRLMMVENAPPTARAELAAAIDVSRARGKIEYRAMRLCAESFQVDLTPYPELANAELTEDEAMLRTFAEKRWAAEKLLVGTEYLQMRTKLHEHVDSAVRIVTEETTAQIMQNSQTLRNYQMLQWTITAAAILLIAVLAALLIYLLVLPMERGVELVRKGELLPAERGVSEYRDLAGAYNEMLHYRRMMESYLRKQSQTDTLTGLPNRLAFQNHITDINWNRAHYSVTAFSLDVNGLKEANDTKGHAFGDALLCAAAEAIRAAFGEGNGRECFRFGGDEFAAFWVDIPHEEIDKALERFRQEQAGRNISVSVGCAYAPDLSATSVEELFEQADKAMYEDKARHHKRIAAAEADQQRLWQ